MGFSVTGRVPLSKVKPAPPIVAAFTVTGDVPVDVSVTGNVVGEFTVTLPNPRLAVLSERIGFGAAVPVPLSETVAVLPLVELLMIVSCPVVAPVAVGLNCTCTVSVCEGFRVAGTVPPTNVKPAPLIVTELTVTGDVPVDVSVTGSVTGEFTVTLPKLRLAVLAERVKVGAAVPFPLRETLVVPPFVELLLTVN